MKLNVCCSLGLFLLLLSACGGSSSGSVTEDQTQLKTYNLSVEVSGVENMVQFDWFGEQSLKGTKKLTKDASSYIEPNNFTFPEHYQCSTQHIKESEYDYVLLVSCHAMTQWQLTIVESETTPAFDFSWFGQTYQYPQQKSWKHWALSYQLPLHFNFQDNADCQVSSEPMNEHHYQVNLTCGDVISISEPLPFAVSIEVAGVRHTFREVGNFSFNSSLTLDSFNIVDIQGPAQCKVVPRVEANTYELKCSEFALINTQAGIASIDSAGDKQLLSADLSKLLVAAPFYSDGKLRYLTNQGIEFLEFDNGQLEQSVVELADTLAWDEGAGSDLGLSALKGDGLYRSENSGWQLARPLTGKVLPILFSDNNELSTLTLTAEGRFRIHEFNVAQASVSYLLPISAVKSTGLGVFASDSLGLITFWDEDERLGYTLASSGQVPVDYIEQRDRVSVWLASDERHYLVKLENGRLWRFEVSKDYTAKWLEIGASDASVVLGMNKQLWLGRWQGEGLLELDEIKTAQGNLLAGLLAKTNSNQALCAKFNFYADELTTNLLPTENEEAWVLLWQRNEQSSELGSIWLTNGVELHQVKRSQSLASFNQFELVYASEQMLVVSSSSDEYVYDLNP